MAESNPRIAALNLRLQYQEHERIAEGRFQPKEDVQDAARAMVNALATEGMDTKVIPLFMTRMVTAILDWIGASPETFAAFSSGTSGLRLGSAAEFEREQALETMVEESNRVLALIEQNTRTSAAKPSPEELE